MARRMPTLTTAPDAEHVSDTELGIATLLLGVLIVLTTIIVPILG